MECIIIPAYIKRKSDKFKYRTIIQHKFTYIFKNSSLNYEFDLDNQNLTWKFKKTKNYDKLKPTIVLNIIFFKTLQYKFNYEQKEIWI